MSVFGEIRIAVEEVEDGFVIAEPPDRLGVIGPRYVTANHRALKQKLLDLAAQQIDKMLAECVDIPA